MAALLHQRCFHHGGREAVARCPECGRAYCRECITEHEGRMVCTDCLVRPSHVPLLRRPFVAGAGHVLRWSLGFVLLTALFYALGALLLSLPHTFHDGSLWQGHWLDQP